MLALTIFLLTYVGVALGRVPGLVLDRTGIALLGAIGMVVGGVISLDQAITGIDFPTIVLLYALMILSAQLRLGGFYTRTASRIALLFDRPRLFLFVCMVTSALLSAVLANDIVCLAFTPVITVALVKSDKNPLPFLIGLAVSSNIGSAATIIGNPQNMLIGQVGRFPFGAFLAWCGPPAVLALVGSYLIICVSYRNGFCTPQAVSRAGMRENWPEFNLWQSTKGLLVAGILVFLFFTSIPRELSAIAMAGVLLCSRKMKTHSMIKLVDWHLIILFCALFVVIKGISEENLPAIIMEFLNQRGIDLRNPLILTGVSTVTSNLVSNVPATMLLIRFLDPANPIEWYTLAVSSTFAGNLILIGSIANLIVIEQAKQYGVEITFREHARVGIPVTVFSLLVLMGWIYL
ncbi:MAG: SLC13 family permease [Desulfatiglandales bacterium]